MPMGNQDDSFVFLQEEDVSQSKHEALDNIRFGNNSLDKQFKRDIELMSLAIVQCGQSEQNKIKADILLKSMLLLFFGQVCYRHSSDQRFYPFSTLNAYFKKNSRLTHFPIAALLLHGSRVLIEFPFGIAGPLMDWLIIDKSSWRYLATHGISALTKAEWVDKNSKATLANYPIYKYLKEEKVNGTQAAINFVSNSISGLMTSNYFGFAKHPLQDKLDTAEHYGIDLALGGVGNQHFASKKIIKNDGEHGHLYINFYQGLAQKKHSGLLLGIEQSAPGKPDQYGGMHDLSVSDKTYSASGGDFFCKKPSLLEIYQQDYQGLTALPIANYYDSLWNFITHDTFVLIKTNFEKCKSLLSLLAKEKSHAFITHLLAASGGAKQEDFDGLFDRYFQEIPHLKTNPPLSAKDKLKTLQQHIQSLKIENQRLEAMVKTDFSEMKAELQLDKNRISEQFKELITLRKQLQNLAIENNNFEKNFQELATELIQLRQQQTKLQNDNKILLINLVQSFMQCVINQMGWLSAKSQKKKILLALQQKTQIGEISVGQLTNILKNFIGVSLMNRYYSKGVTHSAKACLTLLSFPRYQSLTALLEMDNTIRYQDLLGLVSDTKIKKEYFTSAKYKKNLYRFYQEQGSRNQLDEDKLNLAMQRIVYAPH